MKKPRWHRSNNNMFDLNEVAAVTAIMPNELHYEFEVVTRGGFAIRLVYDRERKEACFSCHATITSRLLENT